MGEARRRKERGEYPAEKPFKLDHRRGGGWFGKRAGDGTVRHPDGTRYVWSANGGLRRLVLMTVDGKTGWFPRPQPATTARQRRKARALVRVSP